MGKTEFFLLLDGSESGPWTLGQLKVFWRLDAVTLETLYAQPGASEWKPLSAILDAGLTSQPENSYADEQREMIEAVVNVMLPINAIKLRQWLREKLSAISFAPETDADRESFEDYLAHFSGTEQKQAFGEENLTAYRRGKIKAAQLMARQKHALTLDKLRLINAITEKMSEFTKEQIKRVGEASRQITLDRRARRIREQLGLPEIAMEDSQMNIQIDITKDNTSKEQPSAENALWTMRIKKPVINDGTFRLWLAKLSVSEQNAIFGTENMELYRAGKLTSQNLLDELERVATCIATGNGNELLELAGELFDRDERIPPERVPQAAAIVEHAIKKNSRNAAFIARANSMLAEISAATGKTDIAK
jgi:putative NIF3 family GTP cyclohydrolase 1 type 2